MQVGDTVILTRAAYSVRSVQIRNSERETKLYWIIDGLKYNKSNLDSPGNNIGLSSWIREPKDEQEIMLIERAEKVRSLAKKLSKVEWNSYDLETLESIMRIVMIEPKIVKNEE